MRTAPASQAPPCLTPHMKIDYPLDVGEWLELNSLNPHRQYRPTHGPGKKVKTQQYSLTM